MNALLGMFEHIAGERGTVAVPTAKATAGRRRLMAVATARQECGAARALPGDGWPTRRGVHGSSKNDRLRAKHARAWSAMFREFNSNASTIHKAKNKQRVLQLK